MTKTSMHRELHQPPVSLTVMEHAVSFFFSFFEICKHVRYIYKEERERKRETLGVFERLVGRTCAPVFIFGSCWSYCWFSFSLLHQQQQPETT